MKQSLTFEVVSVVVTAVLAAAVVALVTKIWQVSWNSFVVAVFHLKELTFAEALAALALLALVFPGSVLSRSGKK